MKNCSTVFQISLMSGLIKQVNSHTCVYISILGYSTLVEAYEENPASHRYVVGKRDYFNSQLRSLFLKDNSFKFLKGCLLCGIWNYINGLFILFPYNLLVCLTLSMDLFPMNNFVALVIQKILVHWCSTDLHHYYYSVYRSSKCWHISL